VRRARLARWAGAVKQVISGSEHLWARVGATFPHASCTIVRVPIVPVSNRPLRPTSSPPRVIAFLGGLDRVKGIEQLLQAAPSLASLGLELHVAGDGRLRGLVTGSARVELFESADFAVVPSTYEEPWGPPYVVAEWLAAARPVLCSARGGLAEAASLPGVVVIEPTTEGIVAGARRAMDTWDSLSRLEPVTGYEDMERWLDEHEAVYERAALDRHSSTSA
jgi:glycosyltransferase involved in cell wall biosynthesis